MPRLVGMFERNGMRPQSLGVARVARTEGTRAVIAYLSENGCLGDGLDWETLPDKARESWVKAVSEQFALASRAAAKAALAELAEYEELALLLECRRCGAEVEEPCRDQRVGYIRAIKHPHDERMADVETS